MGTVRWGMDIVFNSVPRDLYDGLVTRHQALQDQYHSLVEELLAMKKDGYTPEPRLFAPESEDDPYPIPENVENALHTLFEPRSPEFQRQKEIAFGMMHNGAKEEDVIAELLAGADIGL